MDNTTLVIILTFVLLILALILLPAASFIRLVELIRENGSQVARVEQAVQQVQTTLSEDRAYAIKYNPTTGTPITQEYPPTPLTEPTETTKSPKDSSE